MPYPVQQFLVGPDAVVGPALSATAGDGTFAMLTVLFVGLGEAGRGVGRRLHDTAVAR